MVSKNVHAFNFKVDHFFFESNILCKSVSSIRTFCTYKVGWFQKMFMHLLCHTSAMQNRLRTFLAKKMRKAARRRRAALTGRPSVAWQKCQRHCLGRKKSGFQFPVKLNQHKLPKNDGANRSGMHHSYPFQHPKQLAASYHK